MGQNGYDPDVKGEKLEVDSLGVSDESIDEEHGQWVVLRTPNDTIRLSPKAAHQLEESIQMVRLPSQAPERAGVTAQYLDHRHTSDSTPRGQ